MRHTHSINVAKGECCKSKSSTVYENETLNVAKFMKEGDEFQRFQTL